MNASTFGQYNQAMETQSSSNDPASSPPQPDLREHPCGSAAPSARAYYPPDPFSAERPYNVYSSSSALPRTSFATNPYVSASARTSFTHVDVDSTPTVGAYPPLRNSIFPAGQAAMKIKSEINASSAANGPAVHVPEAPQVFLTFLLVSGRRQTMSFDPAITVGKVKELMWNAWPADWQDEIPPNPSHLRILYLGKILEDEDTLTHLSFPTSLPSSSTSSPTIIHLSIRPSNTPTVDDAVKKKRISNAFPRRGTINADREITPSGTDNAEGAGCCSGCVIC